MFFASSFFKNKNVLFIYIAQETQFALVLQFIYVPVVEIIYIPGWCTVLVLTVCHVLSLCMSSVFVLFIVPAVRIAPRGRIKFFLN